MNFRGIMAVSKLFSCQYLDLILCSQKFENRLTNINFMTKNIFEEGILYGEMASRGSHYFSRKNLKH